MKRDIGYFVMIPCSKVGVNQVARFYKNKTKHWFLALSGVKITIKFENPEPNNTSGHHLGYCAIIM